MHYGQFTDSAKAAEAKGEKRLAKRIRIEGRICAALVDALLAKDCTVSVNDGEEWVVKRSTDKGTIINALFSTDEDRIVARDADGTLRGSWYLVYGNDGYDVISDYSANDFADAIWEELRPVIDKAEEEMA
jgi:hypothetical protein